MSPPRTKYWQPVRYTYKAYFLWVIPQGEWEWPPEFKWWAKPFSRIVKVGHYSAYGITGRSYD